MPRASYDQIIYQQWLNAAAQMSDFSAKTVDDTLWHVTR